MDSLRVGCLHHPHLIGKRDIQEAGIHIMAHLGTLELRHNIHHTHTRGAVQPSFTIMILLSTVVIN